PSNHQLRKLQGDIARKKPTFALKEQTINQVADRQVYLKAMRVLPDNRLKDVTIYDLTDITRRRTIYADSGELAFAANGRDLILTLHEGSTLEVPRAEPTRLQRAQFDRNYVRVEGVANQLELTRSDPYKSDREMSVCELQNEVARYEAEFIKARTDLRDALLAATREALNGVAAKPPDIASMTLLNVTPGAPAPRSPNASIGRVYCDVTRGAQRVAAKATALLVPGLYAATTDDQGGAPPPSVGIQATPQTPAPPPDRSSALQGDSALAKIAAPVSPGAILQAPIVLSGSV